MRVCELFSRYQEFLLFNFERLQKLDYAFPIASPAHKKLSNRGHSNHAIMPHSKQIMPDNSRSQIFLFPSKRIYEALKITIILQRKQRWKNLLSSLFFPNYFFILFLPVNNIVSICLHSYNLMKDTVPSIRVFKMGVRGHRRGRNMKKYLEKNGTW